MALQIFLQRKSFSYISQLNGFSIVRNPECFQNLSFKKNLLQQISQMKGLSAKLVCEGGSLDINSEKNVLNTLHKEIAFHLRSMEYVPLETSFEEMF